MDVAEACSFDGFDSRSYIEKTAVRVSDPRWLVTMLEMGDGDRVILSGIESRNMF